MGVCVSCRSKVAPEISINSIKQQLESLRIQAVDLIYEFHRINMKFNLAVEECLNKNYRFAGIILKTKSNLVIDLLKSLQYSVADIDKVLSEGDISVVRKTLVAIRKIVEKRNQPQFVDNAEKVMTCKYDELLQMDRDIKKLSKNYKEVELFVDSEIEARKANPERIHRKRYSKSASNHET